VCCLLYCLISPVVFSDGKICSDQFDRSARLNQIDSHCRIRVIICDSVQSVSSCRLSANMDSKVWGCRPTFCYYVIFCSSIQENTKLQISKSHPQNCYNHGQIISFLLQPIWAQSHSLLGCSKSDQIKSNWTKSFLASNRIELFLLWWIAHHLWYYL